MNLGGLSQVTTGLTTLSGLIVVSPQNTIGYQPQNNPSYIVDTLSPLPKALVFNYEGEQTATMTSDVTDHFIENNTAIQDQVALKPNVITTHGFVGELNDIFPGIPQTFNELESKLVTISSYTPQLSLTALLALQTAQQAYQVVSNLAKSAVSTYASINGQGQQSVINGSGISNSNPALINNLTQTQQQIYFAQFYGYWSNRTLFTVQTPWAVFQDMIIQSLHVIQDETTNTVSDFNVTFKQLRFAASQTISTSSDPTSFDNAFTDGQLNQQSSSEVNQGVNPLQSSTTSFPFGSAA